MSTSHAGENIGAVFATSVEVDDLSLRVVLADGRELSVPLAWFPRLAAASLDQRRAWRFIGSGSGIRWDEIDEDLSVAGLLRGTRLG